MIFHLSRGKMKFFPKKLKKYANENKKEEAKHFLFYYVRFYTLANEIRPNFLFRFGGNACLFAKGNTLQQPSHVVAEHAHRL